METRVVAHTQQEKQIQARDLALITVLCALCGRGFRRRQGVERLQLLEVAGECVGIAQADAEEGAELEGFAGQGQVVGGAGFGRQEGVEVQQGEFGAREQLRRLRKGRGFCGVQLLDDLSEFLVGHGCGVSVV